MIRLLLALLLVALTVSDADARRRRHPRIGPVEPPMMQPGDPPGIRGDPRMMREDPRRQPAPTQAADLIPRGWQLQPADPHWNGRRYISPDGKAWLALYARPVDKEAIQKHLQTVAFGEGEQLNAIMGTQQRIAVGGFKADMAFYRQAVLACGGTIWRHVALEFPRDATAEYKPLIERLGRTLDSLTEADCGQNVFAHQ